MELRWIAFIGLCLAIGAVVALHDRATRKTTTKDRNHNLNPPSQSDSTYGDSGGQH